jgi:hypothetical protein
MAFLISQGPATIERFQPVAMQLIEEFKPYIENLTYSPRRRAVEMIDQVSTTYSFSKYISVQTTFRQ